MLVVVLTSSFIITTSFPIFAFLSIIQFLPWKLVTNDQTLLHFDILSFFSIFLNIWVWLTWFLCSCLSLLEYSLLPAKMQFLILFGNSQHPSSRYPVRRSAKKQVNPLNPPFRLMDQNRRRKKKFSILGVVLSLKRKMGMIRTNLELYTIVQAWPFAHYRVFNDAFAQETSMWDDCIHNLQNPP